MKMSVQLSGLICIVIAFQATVAHSDCMASQSFVSPSQETPLPPNPVLYAFVSDGRIVPEPEGSSEEVPCA